jgi:hypothetical protein
MSGKMRGRMSDKPGWKDAMKEPNAIGWIAFLILMIGIGFGTVYFGADKTGSDAPKPMAASQGAK